jgi:hypothetical protein
MNKIFAFMFMFILALTCVSAATIELKSDATTEYYNGATWSPAVAVSWISPLWTNNVHIPATWIWGSDGVTVSEAIHGSDVTFRKTFETPDCRLANGFLTITTDDKYTLKVNGYTVGSDNYWFSSETYDITPYIISGANNTLIIDATNNAMPDGNVRDNPAGVIYSGTVTYFCDDGSGSGNGVDYVPNNTEVPEFSVIAGAVALVGAIGIFLYRRN